MDRLVRVDGKEEFVIYLCGGEISAAYPRRVVVR